MPFEENYPTFFEIEEFGSPAFLEDKRIIGLFERVTLPNPDIHTQKTTFTCASEAVHKLTPGARITVDDQAYTVVELQSDGTGLTRLILERLCN